MKRLLTIIATSTILFSTPGCHILQEGYLSRLCRLIEISGQDMNPNTTSSNPRNYSTPNSPQKEIYDHYKRKYEENTTNRESPNNLNPL